MTSTSCPTLSDWPGVLGASLAFLGPSASQLRPIKEFHSMSWLFSDSTAADLDVPSSSANVPVLRGVGLKQRLKATPTADLSALVRRTAAYDKLLSQASQKDEKPPVHFEPPQWTRLDFQVSGSYSRDDIVRKDSFAVVEAGSTQFKGTHRPDKVQHQCLLHKIFAWHCLTPAVHLQLYQMTRYMFIRCVVWMWMILSNLTECCLLVHHQAHSWEDHLCRKCA